MLGVCAAGDEVTAGGEAEPALGAAQGEGEGGLADARGASEGDEPGGDGGGIVRGREGRLGVARGEEGAE
jgi:hypothetical protein